MKAGYFSEAEMVRCSVSIESLTVICGRKVLAYCIALSVVFYVIS